jgi:signal transduction histidine kinase
MRKITILISLASLLLFLSTTVWAAGTKEQAEAMVKKAIAFYKANGKEKAFAEISNTKGKFVKGELYVFVYDMNGKCVAHGFNNKLIGVDLIEMRDPDNTFFVKERIKLVKEKGKGWQDYKYTNPTTKKMESKTAYVEKIDNYVFGCGVYK